MERLVYIDSGICQAHFPKWSGCFPKLRGASDGSDIATTRAYMPCHSQADDYHHHNYHLGYPGAVGRSLVARPATRIRVAWVSASRKFA